MNPITDFILQMLKSGAGNLASYLAAHVLLCLLPAFFIAGAMTALIPKESITRYLGRNTPRFISYPASALAGFLLAVCSCTVMPLFAGIYKKGAGLGPAITFLFIAPAINILALTYTGTIIGMDIAIARLVLSIAFGIGIGLVMSLIFHKEDAAHDKATDVLFSGQGKMSKPAIWFLVILVVLLVAGTFQIEPLKHTFLQANFSMAGAAEFQNFLNSLVPVDAGLGEEGITVQGAVLIFLLISIGLTAWKGFEHIHDGFSSWTWISLSLIGLTLVIASLGVSADASGLTLRFTGKFFGVLLAVIFSGWLLKDRLSREEVRDTLWESWRFIKQIFPLLLAGVFAIGMIRELIRPEWVQTIAGSNSLLSNIVGVIFGVFMYFPTLVEVPIAQMFLDLGMHRGPLLAYLMADPELSLQSILITAAIIGKTKAWVYVFWVALFSTLAGLIFGAWVDGAALWTIGLYLLLFAAALGLLLNLISRRHQARIKTAE